MVTRAQDAAHHDEAQKPMVANDSSRFIGEAMYNSRPDESSRRHVVLTTDRAARWGTRALLALAKSDLRPLQPADTLGELI
jgi:hypothetical protein